MDDMDDRTALLASIGSLTRRKEFLLREISTIELELATQRAKYARVLNSDAFIYRLPNELLTDILLICQRASLAPISRKKSPKPTIPFQVIASHVSHRWRAVVLATPLLWNRIDLHIRINNHAQGRMLAQLGAHLERSGVCFVDITLEFFYMSLAEPYFDMLSLHARRWRRLAVETNHENVSAFNRLLANVQAPKLEHLSLSVGRPTNEDGSFAPRRPYMTMQPTILLGYGLTETTAPLLTFVRLAGYALGTLHPPLSAITTLHLDGWTRHYITPEQLRALLASAPRLANLSLNQLVMHLPRDPLAHMPPLTLRALRQLRIRGPCSPAARFLGLVTMPALRALVLQGIDTFDCGLIPSVRELSLDGCALDEVDIAGLFNAFPGLEVFSVDESLPDIWTMLLPQEVEDVEGEDGWEDEGEAEDRMRAAPRPWPMLNTLVLRDLQSMDVPDFCFLVSRRRAGRGNTGHDLIVDPDPMDDGDEEGKGIATGVVARPEALQRLTRVCLDRRSRTQLRSKHRLSWLQERIVVEHRDVPEAWPQGLGYVDAHDFE